jgi:flagellar biosynthetic protein FliS
MRGIGAYVKNRASSASKTEVVRLLFGEAVKRLKRVQTLPTDDAGWIGETHHVRAILLELRAGLNREASPEMTDRLFALYTWAIEELMTASNERAPARVEPVLDVLQTLLEGWRAALSMEPQP